MKKGDTKLRKFNLFDNFTEVKTKSRLEESFHEPYLKDEKKRLKLISRFNRSAPKGVLVVISDKSTAFDKIKVVEKCLSNKERKLINYDYDVVFPVDDDYQRHLFREKTKIGSTVVSQTSNTMELRKDYYTDPNGKYLYPVIKVIPNEKYFRNFKAGRVDFNKPASSSLTVHALVNSGISRTGSSYCYKFQSEAVMLYRFDISSGVEMHRNRFKPDHMPTVPDKTLEDLEVEGYYRQYFADEVPTPHFHFCSNTMSRMYRYSAGANAIYIDDLIRYIEDLKKGSEVLDSFDMNMPFLRIKRDETLYAVAKSNIREYNKLLAGKQDYEDLIKACLDEKGKFQPQLGLDGVLLDLNVIRLLAKDYTYENTKLAMDIASKFAIENVLEKEIYSEETKTKEKGEEDGVQI